MVDLLLKVPNSLPDVWSPLPAIDTIIIKQLREQRIDFEHGGGLFRTKQEERGDL